MPLILAVLAVLIIAAPESVGPVLVFTLALGVYKAAHDAEKKRRKPRHTHTV